MRKINKLGQSEMVGFILIVAIVVVILLVFLIISVKKPKAELEDVQVENILSTIMGYTTECAPNFVPEYLTMEELVVSCAEGERCNNLGIMACDYLNESSRSILDDLVDPETGIENGLIAYQFRVFRNDSSEEQFINIREGNCTGGSLRGAPLRLLPDDMTVSLNFCYSNG